MTNMKKYFLLVCISSFLFATSSNLGVKTFRVHDKNRNRLVTMEVWYPADPEAKIITTTKTAWEAISEAKNAELVDVNTKYPLIVMSHGNGGDRRSISWIVNSFIKNNYIVISVEHFGDTFDYLAPDLFLRAWNRPLDVSFSIDYITKESSFKDNIDLEKIGFVGYSLGGTTGVWLSGGIACDFEKLLKRYQFFTRQFPDDIIESLEYEKSNLSYRDPRIKAFFLMAPSTWGFNYESLNGIDTHMFVIGAECDDLLPASTHARFLASCVKNAEYELIGKNAGHYVFLNCISDYGRATMDKRYYADPPTLNRKDIHRYVSRMANRFFNKHLIKP